MVVYVSGEWRVNLREYDGQIRWEVYSHGSLVGRGRSLPYLAYEDVNRRLTELGAPPLEQMQES